MDDGFVTVVETADTVELNFFLAYLSDYGFEVVKDTSPAAIASPFGGRRPYILKVPEADAQRATEFIRELRNAEADASE